VIKEEVLKREIKHVLHFTKIENLSSILERGVFPRTNLNTCNIQYHFNDEIRVDYCEDASCHSISFPNYKMFYSYRMSNPEQEWIVLSLSPRLLWEKDCAFCYSNAASTEISSIPLVERKKPEYFLKMFDNFNEYPKRSELKIKDCCPTNPQAEVLVFDVIERKYLQGIFFQKQTTMIHSQENIEHMKKVPCRYGGSVFSYRSDYEFWRSSRAVNPFDDLF